MIAKNNIQSRDPRFDLLLPLTAKLKRVRSEEKAMQLVAIAIDAAVAFGILYAQTMTEDIVQIERKYDENVRKIADA
jgi:hypothetical protein